MDKENDKNYNENKNKTGERREKEERGYSNITEERRERDIWRDRNVRDKVEKEKQVLKNKKEISKEKYDIKEICIEFENIIKRISNVKNTFKQEDENLLEGIKKSFEEQFNFVKKEVKKGQQPQREAQKVALETKCDYDKDELMEHDQWT